MFTQQDWNDFKLRQENRKKLNLDSEEYKKANKELGEIKFPSIWGGSFAFNHYQLCFDMFLHLRDNAENKDIYPNTVEGMLEWIREGRKD